jgi:hypothetical protein
MAADKPRPADRKVVAAHEIVEIVGELDAAAITSILATGATREDVMEAYAWISADDALHRELHQAPHGTAAAVCEILEAETVPPNDAEL